MKQKRKAIVLCLAALFILAGVLIWQGTRQFPALETKNAVGDARITQPAAQESGVQPEQEPSVTDTAVSAEPNQAKTKRITRRWTPSPAAGQMPDTGNKKPEKQDENKASDSDKKGRKKGEERASVSPRPSASPAPAATATAIPSPSPSLSQAEAEKVRLTIQCTSILGSKDLWKDGLEKVIPPDGIFYDGECGFSPGDSVYHILRNVCSEKDIPLDSQYTPVFGTYYIRGIGNLYEFDCGDESGWKYSVNGITPGEGSSSYFPRNGDYIVFFYDHRL